VNHVPASGAMISSRRPITSFRHVDWIHRAARSEDNTPAIAVSWLIDRVISVHSAEPVN